jgi:DNA-binding winged helix-turn-helix (wHTH) protein/tetratricopeptide (TPR) repeat protein
MELSGGSILAEEEGPRALGYPSGVQRERFRIADLTVDVEAASVTRADGRQVALPRLSFDLLVALARRAPAVVRTDDLIATVWAGTAVSDETLTQRVALLRRALGDDAKSPRYLRAVRGWGYQLVPDVVALAGEEKRQRPRRPGMAGAAALLGVLGLAAALWFLAHGRARPPRQANAISTRSPSVAELLEHADAYLRQHQQANNELAIELYRRALRREPRNPRVLAGLSMALGQRATKFNQHGTAEDQALELARRAVALDPRLGRAHHALGLALDSKGRVSSALAAYDRAARLEPQPAAAWASAGNLLEVQGHLADALEADLRAARAHGDEPVYLEVQLGNTLALLGFEQAAAVWFERAQELRPDNVFAAAAFARMRLSQARPREADGIAAQAVQRGTRRPELPEIRGVVALLAGDEARAESFFREALAVEPAFIRARIRLLVASRRTPRGGADPGLERRRRELADELRRGRAQGDEWPDSAVDELLLAAGFDHEEAALQALDAAIGLGFRDKGWLLVEPMLATLRSAPGLLLRIERIQRLVDAERQRVAGAPWLPAGLLDGSAARM